MSLFGLLILNHRVCQILPTPVGHVTIEVAHQLELGKVLIVENVRSMLFDQRRDLVVLRLPVDGEPDALNRRAGPRIRQREDANAAAEIGLVVAAVTPERPQLNIQ